MTFESVPSGGVIQSTSILDSISYSVGQNTESALGSGGIWGGSTSTRNTMGGLAGLNFGSFMGEQKNDSSESGNDGAISTWGTINHGFVGGRSIW